MLPWRWLCLSIVRMLQVWLLISSGEKHQLERDWTRRLREVRLTSWVEEEIVAVSIDLNGIRRDYDEDCI